MIKLKNIFIIGDVAKEYRLFVHKYPQLEDDSEIFRVVETFGGSALVQSIVASQFGFNVTLITKIGNDYTGTQISDIIGSYGIIDQNIIRANGNSMVFFTFYDEKFRRKVYYYVKDMEFSVSDINYNDIQNYDIVSICTTEPLVALKVSRVSQNHKRIVIFSPQQAFLDCTEDLLKKIFSNCTFVILNKSELKFYSKKTGISRGIKQLHSLGANILIVTLSKRGCIISTMGQTYRISGFKSEALISPYGCGDAFIIAFLHSYLESRNFRKAAEFANAAGAVTLAKKDIIYDPPTMLEVRNFLKEHKL